MESTIFEVLFTNKKRNTYDEAKESLSRVRDIITNITIQCPDISSHKIETIKNKWVELSDPIANGVHTMGLHTGDDYKSLLVHYGQHSYLSPHYHSTEWEVMMILDGECYDKTTDTKLSKGDTFIIPKNAIHHIATTTQECYLYIMFSSNKNNLKITNTEKEIARQLVGKKNSFKAK